MTPLYLPLARWIERFQGECVDLKTLVYHEVWLRKHYVFLPKGLKLKRHVPWGYEGAENETN